MKITIVGAGPVGLLLACLLTNRHKVTVFDKRETSTRSHGIKINNETIRIINNYICNDDNPHIVDLKYLLMSWGNKPINTIEIETKLSEIATDLGVVIRRGTTVESLDTITDSIIIGADGARSQIRQLMFGSELLDIHNVQYMVQLKYKTPGTTRPRLTISAVGFSLLNGLSGSEMVLDFESLAPQNDSLRKPGTLHIPVSESVYNILSANGRGTHTTSWSREELKAINDFSIAKLTRIINRYEFSLQWRGGWLEDARVTALPLTIYRSPDVVKVVNDKLIILVGDASSGLVFERGANKGWLEAVRCASTLSDVGTISRELIHYSEYCKTLYEDERDIILKKHSKIVSANKSMSTSGIVLTSGIGLLFAKLLSDRIAP